ncbi:MAG: type II toxin-antitoxin system RelB/DinJ family antitoxin [Bacilli bacterium]|nr:type II toxin-antitoxin system RelB/DinJ family antitoxin [Bacilli bacterium]
MKERKQAIFSVRMDSETKREFDAICNKMGISTAAAINIFAKQVVLEGGLPFRPTTRVAPVKQGLHDAFEALRKDAEKAGTADMTLDEINEEIRLYREGK